MLPLVTIAVLGFAGFGVWRTFFRRYEASPVESRDEKYRSAREVFSGERAEAVSSADQEAVRATLARLGRAQRESDYDTFQGLMHFRRLVAQMETAGVELGLTSWNQERELVQGLRIGMRSMMADRQGAATWDDLHVVRVDIDPQRAEAVAFALLRDEGVPLKARFWLIKEDGAWKVFDLEMLEMGYRVSSALGALVGHARRNPRAGVELARASTDLQRGVGSLRAGDYDAALEHFRDAKRIMPRPMLGFVTFLEGAAELGRERWEEALVHLERALQLQRDLPAAHHLMGAACFALDRHEDAIRHELEYIAMLGDDPQACLNLAAAYEALGRHDEAIAVYRRGIASDPQDYDNPFNLACLLLERGEHDEALALFRTSCALAPDSLQYYGEAAWRLRSNDADAALLALAEEQLQRSPDALEVLVDLGEACHALERFAEAERHLRRAASVAEGEDEVWRRRPLLVKVLARLARHEEARVLLDEHAEWLEATPHVLSAYVHLAAERPQEAAAALVAGLDDDLLLADVENEPFLAPLLEREDVKAAVTRVRAVDTFLDAVLTLVDQTRWDDVLALARARIQAAPDHADAHYYAGYALVRKQSWAEAVAFLEAGMAKDLPSEAPYYLQELIPARLHLGAEAEALQLVERLAEHEDHDGANLAAFYRAYAHALANREEALGQTLRELLEAAPHFVTRVEATAVFAPFLERPAIAPWLRRAQRELEKR